MWNKRKLIAVFIVVVITVVASFSLAQASSTYPCSEVVPERDATGVSIYTNVTADCSGNISNIRLYEVELSRLSTKGISQYVSVLGDFDSETNTFTPYDPLKPYNYYLACVNFVEQETNSPTQTIIPICDDEWNFTTGGPVGGLTYPNRTARLLAPWMALAALGFSLLGGGLALRKRMG